MILQSEEPALISLSPSRGILINSAQTQKIAATHSEADMNSPEQKKERGEGREDGRKEGQKEGHTLVAPVTQ